MLTKHARTLGRVCSRSRCLWLCARSERRDKRVCARVGVGVSVCVFCLSNFPRKQTLIKWENCVWGELGAGAGLMVSETFVLARVLSARF